MPILIASREASEVSAAQAVSIAKRRYGERATFETIYFSGYPVTFLVVFPTWDNAIVDHPLGATTANPSGKAELKWYQRHNVLLGMGDGPTLEAQWARALESAARGQLEKLNLTVWFNDKSLGRPGQPAKRPAYEIYRGGGQRSFFTDWRPTSQRVAGNKFPTLLATFKS